MANRPADKAVAPLSADESQPQKTYSMEDYQAAFEAEDYLNAVAIWDAMAEENYAWLVREAGGKYQRALPAIVSSFMPKSGGTFLFNRMINSLGYLTFYWGVTRKNSHTEVYPTPKALEVYKRGGLFCHSHALPSPYFRMIVGRNHERPIWVHIRHPGETTLAGYYHYQGEGQGRGAAKAARLSAMEEELELLRSLHGFAVGEWPAFFRKWVGFYASWIAMWLDYADERPGSVFFTFFDELQDTPALLGRVFRTYGYKVAPDAIPDDLPEDRRRTVGTHDWTEGLSEEDIASQQQFLAVWDRAMAMRERQDAAAMAMRTKAKTEVTSVNEV